MTGSLCSASSNTPIRSLDCATPAVASSTSARMEARWSSNTNFLLVSERRGRLGTGDQKRMAYDGRESDGERRGTCTQKDEGIEIDVGGVALKPAMHEVASRRPCNHIGPQYRPCKLPEEHA